MSRQLTVVLFFLTVTAFAVKLRAQEMTLELNPAQTRIEFTLTATLHTVHGTFALKHGTVHFNPETGTASGLIVVDATSGNTGNSGRDHKMHKEILESSSYPEITFTPDKLSGKVDLQGASSAQVDGVLKLHGSEHPVTLTLPVQAKGDSLSAQTHLAIPYIAWGLANPSTVFLHVSDKVDVNITATGRLLPQRASGQDGR